MPLALGACADGETPDDTPDVRLDAGDAGSDATADATPDASDAADATDGSDAGDAADVFDAGGDIASDAGDAGDVLDAGGDVASDTGDAGDADTTTEERVVPVRALTATASVVFAEDDTANPLYEHATLGMENPVYEGGIELALNGGGIALTAGKSTGYSRCSSDAAVPADAVEVSAYESGVDCALGDGACDTMELTIAPNRVPCAGRLEISVPITERDDPGAVRVVSVAVDVSSRALATTPPPVDIPAPAVSARIVSIERFESGDATYQVTLDTGGGVRVVDTSRVGPDAVVVDGVVTTLERAGTDALLLGDGGFMTRDGGVDVIAIIPNPRAGRFDVLRQPVTAEGVGDPMLVDIDWSALDAFSEDLTLLDADLSNTPDDLGVAVLLSDGERFVYYNSATGTLDEATEYGEVSATDIRENAGRVGLFRTGEGTGDRGVPHRDGFGVWSTKVDAGGPPVIATSVQWPFRLQLSRTMSDDADGASTTVTPFDLDGDGRLELVFSVATPSGDQVVTVDDDALTADDVDAATAGVGLLPPMPAVARYLVREGGSAGAPGGRVRINPPATADGGARFPVVFTHTGLAGADWSFARAGAGRTWECEDRVGTDDGSLYCGSTDHLMPAPEGGGDTGAIEGAASVVALRAVDGDRSYGGRFTRCDAAACGRWVAMAESPEGVIGVSERPVEGGDGFGVEVFALDEDGGATTLAILDEGTLGGYCPQPLADGSVAFHSRAGGDSLIVDTSGGVSARSVGIGTLPTECRPNKRLVFRTRSGSTGSSLHTAVLARTDEGRLQLLDLSSNEDGEILTTNLGEVPETSLPGIDGRAPVGHPVSPVTADATRLEGAEVLARLPESSEPTEVPWSGFISLRDTAGGACPELVFSSTGGDITVLDASDSEGCVGTIVPIASGAFMAGGTSVVALRMTESGGAELGGVFIGGQTVYWETMVSSETVELLDSTQEGPLTSSNPWPLFGPVSVARLGASGDSLTMVGRSTGDGSLTTVVVGQFAAAASAAGGEPTLGEAGALGVIPASWPGYTTDVGDAAGQGWGAGMLDRASAGSGGGTLDPDSTVLTVHVCHL